jgi:hypothetical protein
MSLNRAAAGEFWTSLRPVIMVLTVALVCRAGMLLVYSSSLSEDRDNYRRIAEQVARGRGYTDPDSGQPTAYRPPLYPCLIAGVISCGGSNASLGIVHLLLGLGTVGFAAGIGHRLGFERSRFAAAVLVAVDPILLYQTVQVMTETLATFLATVWVWFLVGPKSRCSQLACGAVFGLACLCRPTFWAAGAFVGLAWVAQQAWRFRRGSRMDGMAIRLMAPAVLAAVATVAPWVARNAFVMGRPIVTTTHGGYTLILSHNAEYTHAVVEQDWGAAWQGPSFDRWAASLEAILATLDPPQDHLHHSPQAEIARDRWLNEAAWNYIRQDKMTAFKTGLTLLGRMWSILPADTSENGRGGLLRWAIAGFYVPLFLAVCVGVCRVIRRGTPAWKYPLALIIGYSAVHALYWADMRMRAPLVPALALLAIASVSIAKTREPIQP